MTVAAYPLQWPVGWKRTPYNARKPCSAFKVTWSTAIADLRDTLRLTGCDDYVLSSNLKLRLDGSPRAEDVNRQFGPNEDPGVALYFKIADKTRVMARDTYDRPRDNMRSLGLALKAMRDLERHGGSAMMERAFTGFTAIGDSSWRTVLALPSDATLDRETIQKAYRMLAAVRHPDAPEGSHAAMAELNAARDAALREIAA